jgi:hypothetical protein
MNWLALSLIAAIALASGHAVARNRLTDPLKIARECKSEAELFCKDVRPGGRRIVNCLKARTSQLSPACASALNPAE